MQYFTNSIATDRNQLNPSTNQQQQQQPQTRISHEQQQQQQQQEEECQQLTNTTMASDEDEDAFIAFCADSSSVLNNNGHRHNDLMMNSRRYHINKLYQPLEATSQHHNAGGSQQGRENSEAEDKEVQSIMDQDDEYLLYQELRFIESSAQELCNDESHELTKILDDADVENDNDVTSQLIGDSNGYNGDPLDRRQLTNMIESFDSFAASPLMDACRAPGPDCNQISHSSDASYLDHHQQQQAHINLHEPASQTMLIGADSQPHEMDGQNSHVDQQELQFAASNSVSSQQDSRSETSSSQVTSTYQQKSPGEQKSRRNPIMNHYRRRTANARERIRMREINQAFEKLKKVVPLELVKQASEAERLSEQAEASRRGKSSASSSSNQPQAQDSGQDTSNDSPKLTKITTLRLAVSYIAKLSSLLNESPQESIASLTNAATTAMAQQAAGGGGGGENKKKKRSKDSSISKPSRRRKIVAKKPATDCETAKSKSTSKKRKLEPENNSEPSMKASNLINPSKPIENEETKTMSPALEEAPVFQKFTGNNQIQLARPQQQQQQFIIADQHYQTNQRPTTYITIPQQQYQKQAQYITTYPNQQQQQQQQILISQPFNAAAHHQDNRPLVTPVAVAILGIPTQLLAANNQLASSQQIFQQSQPTAMQFGARQENIIQVGPNKTANLVYINHPLRTGNRPQPTQQICFVNQQQNSATAATATFQPTYQHTTTSQQQQQQQFVIKQRQPQAGAEVQLANDDKSRQPARPWLGQTKFVAQSFSVQSNGVGGNQAAGRQATQTSADQFQGDAQLRESNINKLVASLATSIQPPSDQRNTKTAPNDAGANQQAQQLQSSQQQSQQQQQQQQPPVRTYRFHNYDGNMITNHLYGNTNGQHNSQAKCPNEPQRSRQNSLSSSCSSASANSASSSPMFAHSTC